MKEPRGHNTRERQIRRWLVITVGVGLLLVGLVLMALPFLPGGTLVTLTSLAILGLRALFFLVAGVLHYFRYLNVGLALVLCFVGVKMVISDFYHLPTSISLGTVAGILAAAMLASYLATRREASASNPHPHHSEPDATALEGGDP